MQLALVTLFNAQLANVLRTAVVAFFVALFNLLFFFLVNTANVAHDMAGQMAVRVVAEQARFNFYTWKPVMLRRKFGHLFVSQTRANGQ